MTDYNTLYTPGDLPESVNVVIEIPEGSRHKIEYNRETCTFELDRVEPAIFAKPCNYGFIPQTLDEDGDELDVLLAAGEALPLGVVVQARILGVLNFDDGGEMDHKIICVPSSSFDDDIKELSDLGERWKQKIEHHFTHYKDLKKPGSTKVMGFGDVDDANRVIAECIERWNN